MTIAINGKEISKDIALEIFAQSCIRGDSNPQKISLVCSTFRQIIESEPFWKRLWALYNNASSSIQFFCTTLRQQFAPTASFKEAVILLNQCLKNNSILTKVPCQKVSTNEDKTVDLRLTSSSGGLLEPLPANTASLTLTKNPHVQFLPLLPEAITSITVTDCAVRMLPPLNNLTCLKSLVIGNSQVKQVCLSDLPQLEKVAIYKGQLTAFTVKGCPSVKKVNLEDNQLKEVPTTLAELSALEELKLGGNLITQRPAWLSKIKNAFLDKSYAAPKSNFWNKLKQITHW